MSGAAETIKAVARGALRAIGLSVHRVPRETERAQFSNLDEQRIIQVSLARFGVTSRFCVDIGASDGTTMSNSYPLFRDGWRGIAAEYDPLKFVSLARSHAAFDVMLARGMVSPVNVVALLDAGATPKEFGFLSLDIDGYDYFVLERILQHFRPQLMCVEINEKIPPPIKFTVRWDSRYAWAGDHFYGMSVAKLHELCTAHRYALTELHYNSAFLVPLESSRGVALDPAQAWREGYRDKADRREKFPWNANMDDLTAMTPAEALAALRERFRAREGMFDLHL